MLTGDIEETAEKQILEEYKNTNILKADILKVAHHCSNTSTTQEWIQEVKPKIALIGVGEKNTFGHPNSKVLERLKNCGVKIYRTDKDGEITIKMYKNYKTGKNIEK